MNPGVVFADRLETLLPNQPDLASRLSEIFAGQGYEVISVEKALKQGEQWVLWVTPEAQATSPLIVKVTSGEILSSPLLENSNHLSLPPQATDILQVMFAGYGRVVLKEEFGAGLSGSRVFLVRPIRLEAGEDRAELPVVVKFASSSLIEKEWRAFKSSIHHVLPGIVEIRGEPVFLTDQDWAGLCYPLLGSGTFEIASLRAYCRQADTPDIRFVLGRLMKIIQEMAQHSRHKPEFHLGKSYDPILPVNLLVEPQPSPPGMTPQVITPGLPPTLPPSPGDYVRLQGFALIKFDPTHQTATLNHPRAAADGFSSYVVRVQGIAGPPGEVIEGRVIETRSSLLAAEAAEALGPTLNLAEASLALPDGSRLPNPLLALPELLKVSRHVRVGEIHGDLNLENIMVDPAVRDVSLIDFAEARRDHVLHDFLRLETEIMTKLVAELCHQHGLAPAPLISYFYQQAHWAAFYPDQYEVQPFHPALAKPLAMLMLIRQTARQFFFKVNDPTEYYQGLALYMLGALKFTNLKHAPEAPLPKQIAFWGAAVAVGFYTGALEQGVPDCPYRGLEFFDVQHAPYFFGREALTRRLLTKIEQALEPAEVDTPRFLAIIGPSGSGKSSLARAGLVAAIQRGEIRGSRAWQVAIFGPGVKPPASLAQALTVATPQSRHLFDPPNLAGVLAEDEHALHLAVRQLLSRPDDDRYCVLLVDQFEEIFTLCRDETDRLALLANLRYAATSAESRTIVLLTLRADFYGKCAAYPALAQLLSDHQALVGPMSPDELRRAIEAPARQSICFFEAGLPQKLLDDVQSQAGGLPLLQYALRELWGRQDRRRLTHTAYEAIGRATGALQQRAEAVYEHLTETERQICRRLFLRLTQPGEETEDTKRRVAWPELLPAAGNPMVIESVVRRLAAPETRLIVITGDKEAVVEVAHEALIRNWPRLQGWLDEDREAVLTHRRLTEAALEWQRHDQDASYLYRDSRLGQAEAWAVEYGDDLNALERDFLTASLELRLRQEAAEQARQQKELAQAQQLAEEQRQRAEVQTQAAARLRRRAIWLAAILILLLLAVIAAIAFGFQAQNEADRADANLSTAQYRATQESLARGQAVANLSTAQYRATQEAQARGEAVANLATAQFRATLEAEARNNAEAAATLEALARADADSNLSTAVYRATLEAAARSQAAANLGTAQANATLESLARSTAVAEATRSAQAEQTAQAEATNAIQSEQTAQAEIDRAIQAEQTAQAERATAEAESIRANHEARLAVSRQLAAQSLTQLPLDPTLAFLLSLEAYRIADTFEAKNALLTGLQTYTQIAHRLYGHAGVVNNIALNPGGQLLASASSDGSIILWDMSASPQPRQVGQAAAHSGEVLSVAFSPNGQLLASGNADDTVILWDVRNPQQPQLLGQAVGHSGDVFSVAFSPDGQTLVSGSADFSLILWDIRNPLQPQFLTRAMGHTDDVRRVTLSPDGQLLASAGDDNTIILWQVQPGQAPLQLWQSGQEHASSVFSLAFHPNGQTLASGDGNGKIILWNVQNPGQPQLLNQFPMAHTGDVFSLAFSPDGRTLASGSDDQTIRLWQVGTGSLSLKQTLRGHTAGVKGVAFQLDGQTLISGSADKTMMLWDVRDDSPPQPLGQWRQRQDSFVTSVAFSPDGQTLAAGLFNSTIVLWELRDGQLLRPLAPPLRGDFGMVSSLAFSPDGQTLASGSYNGAVILWDVQDRQQPRPLGQPLRGRIGLIHSVAFSPDGQTLAAGGGNNAIILWDVADRQQPHPIGQPIQTHQGGVKSVAFSPTGQILASGSIDNTIILWDVRDRQQPRPLGQPLRGHTNTVTSVAFSPNGQTLASGSYDKTIILWDVGRPDQPQRLGQSLQGHGDVISGVAFSPDGKTLASGSYDNNIILWDVRHPGQPQSLGQPLQGHGKLVNSVAFSPNGAILASGSEDKNVILWAMADNSWQRHACRQAGRNLTLNELSRYIPVQFQAATQSAAVCPDYAYPSVEPTSAAAAVSIQQPTPTPTATATPIFGFTPLPAPPGFGTPPAAVGPIRLSPLTLGDTTLWVADAPPQALNLSEAEIVVQLPAAKSPLLLGLLTSGAIEPPLVAGAPMQRLTTDQGGAGLWLTSLTPELAADQVVIRMSPPNRLQSLFLFAPGASPVPSATRIADGSSWSHLIYLPVVIK